MPYKQTVIQNIDSTRDRTKLVTLKAQVRTTPSFKVSFSLSVCPQLTLKAQTLRVESEGAAVAVAEARAQRVLIEGAAAQDQVSSL